MRFSRIDRRPSADAGAGPPSSQDDVVDRAPATRRSGVLGRPSPALVAFGAAAALVVLAFLDR